MRSITIREMCLIMALASLTGCGGGGGGGVGGAVGSSPPPPPPPPPPPVPTPVSIFPSITTTTDFATLGYELAASANATSAGFAVRYDAASNSYIFDLPSHAPGAFKATSSDDSFWSGGLPTSTILWPPMSVLKPSATNSLIQLSYTSFASYMQSGPMEDLPHGVVAFGIPTAATAVPTSGSATMNAIVSGIDQKGQNTVGGTASFSFDFGAGTLAGQFNPVITSFYGTTNTPVGPYTFSNTVFGVGSPTFSGSLTHADPSLGGAFNGQFTGPAAQELMARFTATYFIPGVTPTPESMFGIMVGKKCC